MAIYSPSEIEEILVRLSQEVPKEVNFLKFQRKGILVNKKEFSVDLPKNEVADDGQQYFCSVCKKKLISAHLLDLHVSENHDSFFAIQKLKSASYACYLEECKHMSNTAEDRKDHCIKVHKFPHDFRFEKAANKKKTLSSDRMDVTEDPSQPSSAKPKLTTFHFGHKSQKAFTKSRSKKDPIESMVVDLMENLPAV